MAPGHMGGHKPRKIAGAHRAWLARRCRTGAFTLRGLVAELAARGLKVDRHSVWDFVRAEGLSFKKTYGPPRLQVFSFDDPFSLLQRIRPRGKPPTKMEIRAFWS